jgi:hypothetical protein
MANYLGWTLGASVVMLGGCRPSRAHEAPVARAEGMSRTGLHYIVEGTGPAVVLVHAFQMDARGASFDTTCAVTVGQPVRRSPSPGMTTFAICSTSCT